MKKPGTKAAEPLRWLTLLSFVVACVCSPLLVAQPTPSPAAPTDKAAFSLTAIQSGYAAVDGPWRFQTGDDPRWADPAFDDSAWSTIKPGTLLADQGIESYTGYAWYRVRLRPASDAAALALLVVPYNVGEMAVFVNGAEAAHTPGMKAHPMLHVTQPFSLQLPRPGSDGTTVVAIRTWVNWQVQHHLLDRVEVGDPATIAGQLALVLGQRWDGRVFSSLLAGFLFLTVAALGAMLYLAQRHRSEYLWLGLLCLTVAAMGGTEAAFNLGALPVGLFVVVNLWMGRVFMAVTLEFAQRFTSDPHRRLVHGVQIAVLVIPVLSLVHLERIYEFLSISAQFVFCALVVAMLYRAWRRGSAEAGVMLAPFFLAGTADSLDTVLGYAASKHWLPQQFASQRHFLGPVEYSTSTAAFLLFLGSLIAVILYRFVRVSQEEQRSAAELNAARSVQALLIPTELPSSHHFMLEGVYLPANGVGGDFFQVLPLRDESMLIVVGDVSGKGLRAAMNASTLVGALRNEISQEPATVLNHLNKVMLGATGPNAGFATCLCARIYPEGRMIVANAGHLNPYREGRELELAPDLPLGILPNMAYEQACFQLAPGDRLVFLSDGVVEATDPQGQLFGFERTQQISHESARYIAQIAQRFGQNDDITVVSLYFVPTPAQKRAAATVSIG